MESVAQITRTHRLFILPVLLTNSSLSAHICACVSVMHEGLHIPRTTAYHAVQPASSH